MIGKDERPSHQPEAQAYPVLPLRDLVVFPYMKVSLNIGRQKSIRAVECALDHDRLILLAAQPRRDDDDPATDTLPHVVTLAKVLDFAKLQDGAGVVLVEGIKRAKIAMYNARPDHYEAAATVIEDTIGDTALAARLVHSIIAEFETAELSPDASHELVNIAGDYNRIADTLAAAVVLRAEDKQRILDARTATDRLAILLVLMEMQADVRRVENRTRVKVSRQMFRLV